MITQVISPEISGWKKCSIPRECVLGKKQTKPKAVFMHKMWRWRYDNGFCCAQHHHGAWQFLEPEQIVKKGERKSCTRTSKGGEESEGEDDLHGVQSDKEWDWRDILCLNIVVNLTVTREDTFVRIFLYVSTMNILSETSNPTSLISAKEPRTQNPEPRINFYLRRFMYTTCTNVLCMITVWILAVIWLSW